MNIEKIGKIPKNEPRVIVVIPYINKELAMKAGRIHQSRAGMAVEVYLIEDTHKEGWVTICNRAYRELDFDYFIYSCDDYFPGRNYAIYAYATLVKSGKAVCAFNDGKWNGKIATVALVKKKDWYPVYQGDLFHTGYKMHFADSELTDAAKHYDLYVYQPDAVLIEADYFKDNNPHINPPDRKRYLTRFTPWKKGFK